MNCSSCGNDCPVEICGYCGTNIKTSVAQVVRKVTDEAAHAVMKRAIRHALKETSKGGKEISEAKMRAAAKKQLMKAAKEIGKG